MLHDAIFCRSWLVFCLQKLFTIASCTVTSAPKKAHKYFIYSVLLCFYSVSVINN